MKSLYESRSEWGYGSSHGNKRIAQRLECGMGEVKRVASTEKMREEQV